MTFYLGSFPLLKGEGSSSAPVTNVEIVRNNNTEIRVAKRSRPLRRFNMQLNNRDIDSLYEVMSLFEVMNGPEHTFALRDDLDYKSCAPATDIAQDDATIGTGDGSNKIFQLKKQYSFTLLDASVLSVDRNIILPEEGTVLIAVNGALQTETTHYTIDYETGIVTFVTAPGSSLAVTAGFHYFVKVRFDTQDLEKTIDAWRTGSVPSIPMIEVPS